jgi:hypothetical protein
MAIKYKTIIKNQTLSGFGSDEQENKTEENKNGNIKRRSIGL